MIKPYLRFKMVWNRGLSHIGFLRSIIEFAFLLLIFVKLYHIENVFLTYSVLVLSVLAVVVIGYFDIKKGVYELENSINNAHNKELLIAADTGDWVQTPCDVCKGTGQPCGEYWRMNITTPCNGKGYTLKKRQA